MQGTYCMAVLRDPQIQITKQISSNFHINLCENTKFLTCYIYLWMKGDTLDTDFCLKD